MVKRLCLLVFLSGGLLLGWAGLHAQATPEAEEIVPDGTLRRAHVPILMYHYISPLPENPDQYRPGLTVEPGIFYTHLEYLRDGAYTPISLYDLHRALLTGAPLPPRPVILTFDDGHIDHYTTVLPMLQEFGFTATFFIITALADAEHPLHLNWAQIQEMAQAGMSMEAHTKNHLNLAGRDYDFLVYEILGSIESLQAHTGQPVHMFAYPAGSYDALTLQVMGQLSIWRAVTTQHGAYHTTSNWLEVPRLRISGNMSAAGLDNLIRSSF